MTISNRITIDGNVVSKVGTLAEMTIYQKDQESDENVLLYFVRKEKVIGTMNIDADCTQNCGYVSNIDIANC